MARAFNAYKTGDWAKARTVLTRLAGMGIGADLVMKQVADEGASRIRHNLEAGTYAHSWQPLSDLTIELRAEGTKGNPPLYEFGDYIDAIKVVPMGGGLAGQGRSWGVGVSGTARNRNGNLIAPIALAHERGGTSSMGYDLPARPFWSSEYLVMGMQLRIELLALLRAVSRGTGVNMTEIRSVRSQLSRAFPK